jgi:DNA-binding NarL/FixJ family response regulator
MSVVIRTDRDLDSGVTTVWLDGALTWATASRVRAALATCVVECPVAVIVELSGLRAERSGVLSVLPTAARRAARDHGVPLLLCAPGRDIAGPLTASRTFAHVYASHGDALAAVRDAGPRWVHARMAPTRVSVSLARALVGEACLAWNAARLYYPARTVVSELASNAIEHAAGDFEVTAAQVGRYLRIAVQDSSLSAPRPLTPVSQAPLSDRGRGLPIVDFIATHWGTTALGDGKIVWALLRVSPMSAMSAVAEGLGVSRIRPERLTEREVDVLRYLPTMLTAGEIATELHLSVYTVKADMKSIYRKLDASRRREAVDRAYELDPDGMYHRVAADAPMPPIVTSAQPTALTQRTTDRRTGIRTAWTRSGMSAVAEGFGVSRIRPERLTEREVDVLRYLSTMLTAGEIATELGLSVYTVKAHMKSIYRKLDASRRREAVDRACELGVIAQTTPADERPRR